jgi:hypothetical protein
LRVVRSRETRELLMKNLSYGSSAMLVSDDTAAAVLHYTAVLAMTRSADVVEVPTIDAHGAVSTADIVLGPGIPLIATPAPDDVLEEDHPVFVEELTSRVLLALSGGSPLR